MAMGVTDLAPFSEPVIDAGYITVVGSACPYVFEAGSGLQGQIFRPMLRWPHTIVIFSDK